MKKTLGLLLSVLLLFGTLSVAFSAEYPEVSITAEKTLLTASDLTSDGSAYLFRLSAEVTGTENTDALTYSWSYREKGVTAWWRKCPDVTVQGCALVMPISSGSLNVYKGVEFICTVSGGGLEPFSSETAVICAAPFFTANPPETFRVKETELSGDVCAVSLKVAAEGFGELTYVWELSEDNGDSWTECGTNADTLEAELPCARFTDGKTLLRCRVTDENGNSAVSSATLLDYASAPVLTADLPESYVYKTNEYNASEQLFSGHTFCVTAEGEGLSYAWQLSFDGGKTWEKADCDTNRFAPVLHAADFAADSSVLIRADILSSNGIGISSGVCRCSFAPVILADLPATVYVDADDVVTVNGIDYLRVSAAVEAMGCSELSYQWYYTDLSVSGAPYKAFPSACSPTMENALIPKEAVLWTSHIRCDVTDRNGDSVTSSGAKVVYIHKATVQLPESIRLTGKEIVDGVYECKLTAKGASREKAHISYRWFERYGDSEWFELDGDTAVLTRSYTLPELLSNISIKCEATVYSRFTTESDVFKIELAPTFTKQTEASAVEYGEAGTIHVEAVSTDEVVYTWLRSTDNYRWFILGDNDLYSGCQTDTLTVSSVKETEYNTYYRCRAVAGGDTVYSKQVKFLKPAIKITGQPSDAEAAVGKEATFTVKAEGIGLTYRWTCCDYASFSWKTPVKNADIDVSATNSDTLTVRVKSELAYAYMFRCTVSDGDREVYTGSVRLLPSENGGNEPTVTETVLRGDIDKNGKVEAADARLALRASVGLEKYAKDSDSFLAADWNSDGKIGADDARSILRKAVGLS